MGQSQNSKFTRTYRTASLSRERERVERESEINTRFLKCKHLHVDNKLFAKKVFIVSAYFSATEVEALPSRTTSISQVFTVNEFVRL